MSDTKLAFVLNVEVEARDEPVTRGHWRKGQIGDHRKDWITEEVPPLTHAQLVREVRVRLNEMFRDYGLSSSDFHFEVVNVTGGRIKR